jgi:hypothetical protein
MSEKKPSRSWQEIAQLASGEKDPEKLRELVDELTDTLDERDKVIHPANGKNQAKTA